MKKILLIEDRQERQALFMSHSKIDLYAYSDVLDNKTAEAYDEMYDALKNEDFNFHNYSMVIAHKSAFNGDTQEILYKIECMCKELQIPLVLFSGGITANYYEKLEKFIKLELNSKVFYSQNLQLFFENYTKSGEIEPLILSYGERWQLNIVLNSIEKINNFITLHEKEEDILYDEFVNATDFHLVESLKIKYTQPNIENGWVYLVELKELALSINIYLEESILYEQ